MVMQGRALALKNTCRNASSTSVEKHLSWSPDIHPTARWVPSTPHRARPAGHPPTRHPGAVDARSENATWGTTSRPTTRKKPARPQLCHRRCAGQLRQPAPDRDHPRPGLSLAPFACPVAAPPTTADARGVKTETMSPPPERSPRGAHTARCPGAATPALPSPRHNDGLRGKPDPCRKHPAPPPSRCSKDVTTHPQRTGGRPDRPCPEKKLNRTARIVVN